MRDKDGHFIMIKETIYLEDKTHINIYVPHKKALEYTKQPLTEQKGETDKNTIRIEELNTPLLAMDR